MLTSCRSAYPTDLCQTSGRVHAPAHPPPTGTVVAVVGATASGKSALALDLAERLGGEIVNTDSMQVYRGMDIGTAKLPPDQRRGITHHLMDVLEVTEAATVAQFQGWARRWSTTVTAGRRPRPGGWFGALRPRDPRRVRVPGHRPRGTRAAGGGARRGRGGGDVRPARRGRPGGRGPDAAAERPPRRTRPRGDRDDRGAVAPSLPEPRYHYAGAVQVGVDIDRATLDRRIEERVEQMWADGVRRGGPGAGGARPA